MPHLVPFHVAINGGTGQAGSMRFTNLTRRVEIGANSYLLETGGKKIVIDAGMHPKAEGLEASPDFSLLGDGTVDAILVSHAHQDHLGCLPVLTRGQPRAKVFMTASTADLADTMLHNSVNVMSRKREELGLADYPLFTHRGADLSAAAWQTCPLEAVISYEGERLPHEESASGFSFHDAGHILGSAGILLREDGRRIFYTGDVNFENQTLLPGAAFPEGPIDVLIMETTRGDSPLPPGFTRAGEEERFCAALNAAYERGGAILIPVFALGKTQEILTLLYRLRRDAAIRLKPVYIGGLSTKITSIYDKYRTSTGRLHPRLEIFDAIAPFTLTGKNVEAAKVDRTHIYALSSGMMTENTLSNGFARRILERTDCSIFFVGYADPASPAGRLKAAGMGGTVQLDPAAPAQEVRCHIGEFNFSAHASRESLRTWVGRVAPKKVVLVHGDPAAVEWFRSNLAADLPGSEILVPEPGKALEL